MQYSLDTNRNISLEDAIKLWSLSNVIYIGPTGPRARRFPEFEIFRRIADDPRINEQQIFGLLQHDCPAVVGYAFELLISRGSKRLNEAAIAIGDPPGEVSMGLGCLVSFQPLGTYVRNRIHAEQIAAADRL